MAYTFTFCLPSLSHMAKFIYLTVIIFAKLLFCKCENIVLNISGAAGALDLNKVNSNTYFIDGLPCRKLTPKPNKRVVKVMDGKLQVWEGNNSECTDVIVYPETGRPKLAHLFITKKASTIHEYYTREGENWTKISEVKYRTRLNEFSPTNSKSGSPTAKKKDSAHLPSLFIVFLQAFLYIIF
ncbi:hypothetical protein TpMuguga_01g01217 [Theileria parva strain Muguga]|uniref:Signal peptide containing protein n=1 Tax=Theileria parva TaxID=5875 RepID=Q4N6F3_THEPA|nr:uncharacterized protein TpMuguga_01g01217 [Theileria parva strain Muguga]EAN34455.1 hypothetical protein TpMuguga_01g01217 [Theileria parva strain Muguga]|eukprot:XP_766738.1 hypothetical protein [Theileria parva strain Muguga]